MALSLLVMQIMQPFEVPHPRREPNRVTQFSEYPCRVQKHDSMQVLFVKHLVLSWVVMQCSDCAGSEVFPLLLFHMLASRELHNDEVLVHAYLLSP